MTRTFSLLLHCSAAALAIASTSAAAAQPAGSVTENGEADEAITTSNEIVVQANIGYRNRSDDAEPVLVYDTDYFQRFEPLTIGDALKRVPGVTFLSDVIESDGARLRGLDPGYTQVLINGEKVPGANADRTFFLDRIPAEQVERIEIVRSNSARRTADAVAGSLNIVLRDAFELDGGYVKGGGLLFDDGEVKPVVGAFWGGAVGPGRLMVGGNIQGRYNPKKKSSLRFDDDLEFDNREDQDDTRDGTDYSVNASYGLDLGDTKLELSGFYVRTDRTEHERSREYDDESAETGPVPDGNLLTDNGQFEDIDQESFSLAGKVSQKWSLGRTSLKLGYARFKDKTENTEVEIDFDTDEDPPEWEAERVRQDIRDTEFSVGLDHAFQLGQGIELVVGGFYQDKDRDTDIASAEDDDELSEEFRAGYDQFDQTPADLPFEFDEFEPVTGGFSTIEERRLDGFALVEGQTGIAKWEIGVRYETTDVTIHDFESDERFDNDYEMLLPSASVKLDVSARDRITASVARTNRRPRFDYISPATLEGELGDNDLRGNPHLMPEKAWGIDVGYERRIGRTGVAGVNIFYRKVNDLVELVNTGEPGDDNDVDDCLEDFGKEVCVFIFEPENVGNGKTWGVEFDLSTSLAFVGLDDTGIFGNLALIDSEVRDDFGKRRFNGQPKYVYNIGFIQDLKSLGAAFGATYRKQGPAKDRLVGEEVRTTYGADLEVFVEKRFGNWLTIRGVGSNLLNAKKKEEFLKYNTIDDQLAGNFDEYELESEKAGPVFQLIARAAF
jgi:iron complex outermembrane receptor protein